MLFPKIHISKRERRKYKSNVAAWKVIREEGIARFIAVRGVLLRGLPGVIIAWVGVSFYLNDFRFDTKFLTEPWLIVVFLVMGVIADVRYKLDEWLTNEREYKAWRLHKSKRNLETQ